MNESIPLYVGQQAPSFKLLDDQGHLRTLEECRGKKVALMLYPKDGSFYCTKQACTLKLHFQKITEHQIIVFGISSDATKVHHAFKKKYELPFALLTATEDFLHTYEATGLFFNARKTVLIDEVGVIVSIIKNVDVTTHADQILKGFGL